MIRSGFSFALTGHKSGWPDEISHVKGSISGRVSGRSIISKDQHLRPMARQVSGGHAVLLRYLGNSKSLGQITI